MCDRRRSYPTSLLGGGAPLAVKQKFDINEAAASARQLSEVYYKNYDKKRDNLKKLYLDSAILIWNGNGVQGADAVCKYLSELPSSVTKIECVDCHPIPEFVTQGQKSMTLTVMGTIRYDTTKPKTDCFTQTFMMTTQPSATGGLSWKIARDCFRTIE